MKKKCVVIFNNSWGEVDFILPALQILKNNNYEILIAFRFDNCFEKKNEYLDLYSGLKKISTKILNEENIQTQKFGFINFFIDMLLNPKIFFSKILNFNYKKIYNFLDIVKKDKSYQFISFLKSEKQIDLFLCADFDSNYSLWVKNFPKSKYFLFPHAITLRGSAFNHLKNVNKNFSKQSYALRTHQLSQFPSNTILYVKEHPAQIKQSRSKDLAFFKNIKSFSNVRIVPTNLDSSKLIKNAEFVISGSGTSLFEGILLA